jgi:hypothetical protein
VTEADANERDLVRASDAERGETVNRLRDAAVEGRLTFEELADRVGAAWAATTLDELARLTGDLLAHSTSAGAVKHASARRSTVFGDVRRTGPWKVPESSTWRSVFGNVVLDLRQAQLTTPIVTIDAGTVFGDIDVLVPEGVAVELSSRTVLGDVREDAADVGHAGAPRVILTGGAVFGDVRVRARRLGERVAASLVRSSER